MAEQLRRPGPCEFCDDGRPGVSRCMGVDVPGLDVPVRWHCTILRAMWDAGYEAALTWRQIATAPHSVRVLLLLPATFNERIVTGKWVDAPRRTNDPTHWMPLPEVPDA